MRADSLEHVFVEFVPAQIEPGKLYISITYATASHLCACGCDERVVTPLSPADWSLTFDGEAVSLYPSIGNWAQRCRSHYWIRQDRIIWGTTFSEREIEAARARARRDARRHFDQGEIESDPAPKQAEAPRSGWLARLLGR